MTIGGGTGTPVINEALLRAGVDHISSIVTVMDSGGITGRMRTDSHGQEVAYSDAMRTMLSLIRPDDKESPRYKSLEKILRSRTETDQLGYSLLSHLFDKNTGFAETQKTLEVLTGLHFYGEVIPVTTQSTNICFETKSGETFCGEHELDNHRMSKDAVTKIWLDPGVEAFPDAIKTLQSADIIIFAFGSLYGSVISNLLPVGMVEAYKSTRAQRLYITNLASTRNETHEFLPQDFINVFKKYTGLKYPLTHLVIPRISRQQFEDQYPEVAKKYDDEHSHFLGWEQHELPEDVRIIPHQATAIEPIHKRLRHDAVKLEETFDAFLSR